MRNIDETKLWMVLLGIGPSTEIKAVTENHVYSPLMGCNINLLTIPLNSWIQYQIKQMQKEKLC